MTRKTSQKQYRYEPVGMDAWDEPRPYGPQPGETVVKVQPFGAPKNGIMRQCYAEPVARPGDFRMVNEASLTALPK